MHARAFYVFVLVLLSLEDGGCEDKTRWYNGLRTVLKNCPLEPWTNSGQDDILQKFRKCVQGHALDTLDSLLTDDVIPVFDGLDLVRFWDGRLKFMDNYTRSELGNDTNWTEILMTRLLRILRTHVLKVDVDYFINNLTSPINNTDTNGDINMFEGRRRRNRRRNQHMVPLLLMGFVLMGSILIPMGFQFLAVLGGKALLLAKMALILSSIQGLKKIATNGVNYGLYHTPAAEGWHDRSHIEPPPPHLEFPLQPHFRP